MSSIVDLAKNLSGALLGKIGIPDCIGALILGELFPGGDEGQPPSYFTEVYQEIKNIVQLELTQLEINDINGVINGTNDWVRTEYMIFKDDPKQASTLFAELRKRQEGFYTQVIAKLRLDRYRMVGFSVFLIGAGVHLALLQELAMRDDSVPGDPWSSDYTKLLLKLEREYSDYARTIWSQIAKIRHDAVQLVDGEVEAQNVYNVHWTDPLDGSWGMEYSDPGSDRHENALKQVEAVMKRHQDEMVAKLQSDIGEPNTVVADWEGLRKRPLPLPSTAKISVHGNTESFPFRKGGYSMRCIISWETTDAVEVLLDSEPVEYRGSRNYEWYESEFGPSNSPKIPTTMTALDKHGCPVTTPIFQ